MLPLRYTEPALSALSVLWTLINECLVSLLFTKELLIMSVWVFKLETLWDGEIIRRISKKLWNVLWCI